MAFKTPTPIVDNLSKVPPFDKEKIVAYLKNYGNGFTNDDYVDWAKKKGKTLLPPKPLNPEFAKTSYVRQFYGEPVTYADQYLNDDEYLQGYWNDAYEDILEDYYSQLGIDADYERSYGPVTNEDQYQAYLKWKGNN